ncbi:MAG: glutathione S-transferase family protein [Halioglobus sp.]|nr:glutathione S-transferase family protein [Halioglobus sp.]
MMQLYTFPETFGLRNVSPFCLKVEMALAYLGVEYEIVEEKDPRKSPKGKLPYIKVDGSVIPDSEIILEYLDGAHAGKLYGHLTDEEYSRGYAFTRLSEDHLYWLMVASRWLDDDWFRNVVDQFFDFVPWPIRTFASKAARKGVARTLDLHGLGRHNIPEQKEFVRRDLEALNRALSSRDFIAGDRLTAFDFAVAGLLAGIYDQQPPTWINPIAQEYPDLQAYAERVQEAVGVFARH